ncbi:uncharacterized protein K02A2.6-like [Nematostella vectensis]|uniref:uncharacterized protein K02A2.6-like n=1 Tax=Nematostella vectensis TaxID=45351 RepID=UPI00207791EF|nr:uncharacterized protein K02A2.6-like [Nematostella vectensis]
MAELTGLTSPRMDWNATDLQQALKKFKATVELYFSGPLKSKSEEEKVSYLLIWTGEEGIELVSTWSLTSDEKKKLSTYWEKFEECVAPKSNFRLARFKLRTLKQKDDEPVDSFIKKVRLLASECRYDNVDEHIIDALIFGSRRPRFQAKLLELDKTLTLAKAIDIARTEEATSAQLQDIRGTNTIPVHATTHKSPSSHPKTHSRENKQIQTCGNCGTSHNVTQKSLCPANGTKCSNCGKPNHWAKVCRSTKPQGPTPRGRGRRGNRNKSKQQINTLSNENASTAPEPLDSPQLYFHSLTIDSMSRQITQALVNIQVNSSNGTLPLLCKIDTGAEGNVIPLSNYKHIYPESLCDIDGKPLSLAPSDTRITAYGGHEVQHYGTCNLTLLHNGQSSPHEFHVVNTTGPTILGLPTCTAMKLVTLNHSLSKDQAEPAEIRPAQVPKDDPEAKAALLRQYVDCFEGIGCFSGEFHITLDPTVPAVVHPPRRVPEALQEPLRKELESLVQQGIITKVDEPTDWVNSLVCSTKRNGSIRLCLDPKDLNCAIKRPHHRTPTLDEVLSKLSGSEYFSIVDARSGYWNIKLDQESSLYTTFNSPHGRFRFLRLPFGLICAQDIFQKKVDETFGDLPGVTGITDDIVVYGRNRKEHDYNLKAVMERARETGLKFNADKCKIASKELVFFGHTLSADGLKLDPAKVEAINNMDPSTSLTDLQVFLGMTQYLSRFIPNLASTAAVLWDLTRKSSQFQWCPEHQKAVDDIKKLITSPASLQYFDSTKPVVIQVDASQRGLGATLIQDKGPVEYRSKLLTETERRYSNIEREMLAVVHGLEKFHYYAYGRHVQVHTDHKPLEAIFKKHLASAPPRIARMMQPDVLQQLHYAHQGAEKCKLRAKGSVFWANINADIDNMVKSCAPCQHNQSMNTKEPLMPHDVPPRPWHTLASDLFSWNGSPYLLLSDYYSKFPIVRKLTNIQSSTVIAHLKGIFEEHGIPDKLVTGHDTQFTSALFKGFSSTYGFIHTTTSPYYKEANGFIERNVQTVKDLLQKCKESGQDPHLAMLCLRTTPLGHTLPSPAELLNSRIYQSNLPATSRHALLNKPDYDANVKLQARQDRQKSYYDRTSKCLQPVYPQDAVRVFNPLNSKWEPGIVRAAAPTPRSHIVDMANGSTLTRNRRHIRPTGEKLSLNNTSATDDYEPVAEPAPNGNQPPTEPRTSTPGTPAKSTPTQSGPPLRRSTRTVKPPDRLNL